MPWRFVLGDRSASVSAAVCAIGLGGFLLWAGLVPLDEAVSAPGQIVVEDNRKVVQHLEGGIVRRLHVREGQEIEEGSILLELDDVRARAMRDQAAQKVAALRAARDRLTALTGGLPQLHFAPTDDLDLEIRNLQKAGVSCDAVTQQGWGRLTRIQLPGGGTLGLYQPRHQRPQ